MTDHAARLLVWADAARSELRVAGLAPVLQETASYIQTLEAAALAMLNNEPEARTRMQAVLAPVYRRPDDNQLVLIP